MKELFQPVITTASNLINDLSSSNLTPNLVPKVAGTLSPRVKTIPTHNNSISLQQQGVNEATNRYTVGSNIIFFDGTFYCEKTTPDNGKMVPNQIQRWE